MKYKVGDHVRIKSLDWYNENKDEDGIVDFPTSVFVPGMSQFCGKIVTIEDVFDEDDDVVYCMEEIDYDWTDEMIEGLAEEEVLLYIDDFQDDNEIIDIIDEYVHRLKDNECQINLPEGYQFKDENGNVINAMKIVLEKKKKEYPKTYEECCRIMDIDKRFLFTSYNLDFWKGRLLTSLQKLLICRDAYWKIAGEEMGLGKPWKPDWDYLSTNHEFIKINKGCFTYSSRVLVFPTEEMRDAFYENFKSEIEICKEFL